LTLFQHAEPTPQKRFGSTRVLFVDEMDMAPSVIFFLLVLSRPVYHQIPQYRCPRFPCQVPALPFTAPSTSGRRPSPPLLATDDILARCIMRGLPLISSSRATAWTASTSLHVGTPSLTPYPAGTPTRLTGFLASCNWSPSACPRCSFRG
jgi:hypothetical protein